MVEQFVKHRGLPSKKVDFGKVSSWVAGDGLGVIGGPRISGPSVVMDALAVSKTQFVSAGIVQF
jgi:hypothetical protein